MSEWVARPLNIQEVHGLGPGLARVDSEDPLCTSDIECRQWCIHPGFKTHGQSQLKSETENTSGSTNGDIVTTLFFKCCCDVPLEFLSHQQTSVLLLAKTEKGKVFKRYHQKDE